MSVRKSDDMLSVEEAWTAIEALSLAEHAKLQRVSRFYAGSRGAADDLRQEAMLRTLDGTRRCPREIQMIRHLDQVMRSMIWSERKSAKVHPHQSIEVIDTRDFSPVMVMTDLGPEVQVAEAQAADRVLGKVIELFNDDKVAQTVLEGIILGWEGEELCELAGIDRPTLATKRKLINRRIARAFPDGWNHDG